tara:strand:+ start:45 stop:488 length:444 start_codon:yes stop_codon:yes gene_type:complete
MVQTKEEKRIYDKIHYEANKEEKRIYNKIHYEANKEQIAIKRKFYNDANKEKIKNRNRDFYNSPKGKKTMTILNWKRLGVIGDLDTFYDERYLPATQCEVCHNKFKSTFDKHMDHSHDSGEIRFVLCRSCNCHDYWKKVMDRKNKIL